jgi:hypothetical protein
MIALPGILPAGERGSPTLFDEAGWSSRFETGIGCSAGSGPCNHGVLALARFQGDLYAGGNFFTTDGGLLVKGIARWDGSQWHPLGSLDDGPIGVVSALQVTPDGLYVGGAFTDIAFNGSTIQANNIARWNGSSWSVLADGPHTGVNGRVMSMVWNGLDLYVGGLIGDPSSGQTGFPAHGVARWDGNHWSVLGNGFANGIEGSVFAIGMLDDDVYVGGIFDALDDGIPGPNPEQVRHIARWDGQAWHGVGSAGGAGLAGIAVRAMTARPDGLYVGGEFTQANAGSLNPLPVRGLARWDGQQWHQVGGAPGTGIVTSSATWPITVLTTYRNSLLVGGTFTELEINPGQIVPSRMLALLSNEGWIPAGDSLSALDGLESVLALLPEGQDALFVGGRFDRAGRFPSINIAEYRERLFGEGFETDP